MTHRGPSVFSVIVLLGLLVGGIASVANAFTVDVYATQSVQGGQPMDTGLDVTAGQLLVISADNADRWKAGAAMVWGSNANGMNHLVTYNGFTFPVGALVGSLDRGTTFFLVGTNLSMPVQTGGRLNLYFWDANAFDNEGAIQVTISVEACPPSFPICAGWTGERPIRVDAREHSVQAGQGGQAGQPADTGLDVRAGQLLVISADNVARWKAGAAPVWGSNANGMNHLVTYKGFTFRVGALVGSIDDGSTFFLVGTSLSMRVQTGGRLKLYFWDANAFDNEGAIQVAVKVITPQAPILASIGNQTVNVGVPVSLTASASGQDGDPLNFSLTASPAGAKIETTGAFSWTPLEAQGAMTHTVTVKVTDSAGLSDTKSFTITVRPQIKIENRMGGAPTPVCNEPNDPSIIRLQVEEGKHKLEPLQPDNSQLPAESLSIPGGCDHDKPDKCQKIFNTTTTSYRVVIEMGSWMPGVDANTVIQRRYTRDSNSAGCNTWYRYLDFWVTHNSPGLLALRVETIDNQYRVVVAPDSLSTATLSGRKITCFDQAVEYPSSPPKDPVVCP